MRLTELFALPVRDRDGASAGTVRDLRTTVEYADGDHVRRIRIDGLVAGRGEIGERFGYAYGHARGPWVLAAPMKWLARHTRYVPWDRVVEIHEDAVTISGSAGDLPSVVTVEEASS